MFLESVKTSEMNTKAVQQSSFIIYILPPNLLRKYKFGNDIKYDIKPGLRETEHEHCVGVETVH